MVELETMYPGIAFSPQTKLTAAINETDTVISVESTVGLPDGPNYATIGADENAETIYYAVKLSNQLSGCVRGVEGAAKAWAIGDVLGRNFTAKDYRAILSNILALKEKIAAGQAYTLTHSKEGTSHVLSGVPESRGVFVVQFAATADFNEGDVFEGYTAKAAGEDSELPSKAFVTGDLVSAVLDTKNKKLGFKLGGGDKSSSLPPPVTSLLAEGGDQQITVSFEEVPSEYDKFLSENAAYIVVVKKGSIPSGPTDGDVIVKLDKTGAEVV